MFQLTIFFVTPNFSKSDILYFSVILMCWAPTFHPQANCPNMTTTQPTRCPEGPYQSISMGATGAQGAEIQSKGAALLNELYA